MPSRDGFPVYPFSNIWGRLPYGATCKHLFFASVQTHEMWYGETLNVYRNKAASNVYRCCYSFHSSFLLLLHLIPTFMYDDIPLHVVRSYTSSADSPFPLISSFTLSNHLFLGLPLFLLPCTFNSYVVLLCSYHMLIPLQPPFLDFLCDFPHFRSPSFSYLVQLRHSAHPS